jgi:hypothetical protein
MLEVFHEVYAAGLLDKGFAFVKQPMYGPSAYGVLPQEELEGVWGMEDDYYYTPDDQTHLQWIKKYYAEYGELPGSFPLHQYLILHAAAEAINNIGSLDPDLWIPEIKGKPKTGLATDGEYMFQAITGRLLWPVVLLKGKAPEDRVDIFPDIPEIGAEWDRFDIVYTFGIDYQAAIVPEEAILQGTDLGGPGIGDAVLDYWK